MSLARLAVLFGLLPLALSLAVKPSHSPAFLGMNASHQSGKYGKAGCKCVGIDNLKGWFGMPIEQYHVQYPVEVGASCEAWEENRYPDCKKKDAPKWCSQKWCYVDPCTCDLEILPKMTVVGVEYQGSPAYWSYDTCGGKDAFSTGLKDACVNQETEEKCSKFSKCAWNGKQCGGKEVIKTCAHAKDLDESIHGQEDCRCIGHTGKNGIAKLAINDTHQVDYPADVGGRCAAWESHAHPDCKKDGMKPSWCEMKWCFVDPCKCKTAVAPKAVMKANSALNFQGALAHWSYETCGSTDTWSSGHKNEYCATQKTSLDCLTLDKCTWTGDECTTKEIAEMCGKSGLPHSGTHQMRSSLVLAGMLAAALAMA